VKVIGWTPVCRIWVPTWFMVDWPARLTAKLDWPRRMGWWATEPPPVIMATWVRDWGMEADMWPLGAGDMPGGGIV